MMCRKSLEALCAEFGATGRNLKEKIEKLSNEEKVDSRLAKWADQLRLLGNDAAHGLASDISSEDARDGIHFVEAILENVFVLERRFREFCDRRKGGIA